MKSVRTFSNSAKKAGSGCALIVDDVNPLPDRSGVTSMNFDSGIFAPVISLTWLTATTDQISTIPGESILVLPARSD